MCTSATLLALFPVKDLLVLMIFKEGPRGGSGRGPRAGAAGRGPELRATNSKFKYLILVVSLRLLF